PSVQLLRPFDPVLVGDARRGHLVDAVYAPRVSRTAGWIAAVVLVGGRVVAAWTHAVRDSTLHISIEPFQKLAPHVMPEVRHCAAALARAMGLSETALSQRARSS